MIYRHPQDWKTSTLPFSLALQYTVNTGVSFDTPSGAIANSKHWAARGFQGLGPRVQYPGAGIDGLSCGCGCGGGCGCGKGMGGLTFDGTGLLGTGLFAGDISTWGWEEMILVPVIGYAVYAMFFQAKQTKYRLEAAGGRRRKRRAARLRAKAKRLEEAGGGVFGF